MKKDFGLSRFGAEDQEIKTKSDVGPIKWMSPEAIKDKVCFVCVDTINIVLMIVFNLLLLLLLLKINFKIKIKGLFTSKKKINK